MTRRAQMGQIFGINNTTNETMAVAMVSVK